MKKDLIRYGTYMHRRRQRERGGGKRCASWNFMHSTDKVEGGLKAGCIAFQCRL